MTAWLTISTIIFLIITIYNLYGDNYKKTSDTFSDTFYGECGFAWIEILKKENNNSYIEKLLITLISLSSYIFITIIISLIIGGIIRLTYLVLIPIMIISLIILKIKKK